MRGSPFDHRQDRELGETLRAVLSAEDDFSFVERVLARAGELQHNVYGVEWWEVLSAWARPGLVAVAVVLIAGITIWFSGMSGSTESMVALGDPLLSAGESGLPSALFAASQPPDLNEVLALVMGN
ncbi:MAG: hypothetical protein AMS18_08010 [Gemmatimonas sp. SG8_17]|nr:MAG: hypothetical protein AMS18_08010 [Gemmatimonas sp. SG8_17]